MLKASITRERLANFIDQTVIYALLAIGLWLVVFRPMGPGLSLIPGDLGDARFNNYILEHVFRRLTGLDNSFWRAPFFYPFPQTTAFSDTFLGSAPIYIVFRLLGLDRETAFQCWFIPGFILNYIAAICVLKKLKFRPLATAVGGFFFAFGLPMLGQINHAQLLYRFPIPLAFYMLWRLIEKPGLFRLAVLVFWFVWQFYLGIYMGVFLALCLASMAVLLPFFFALPIQQRFLFWLLKLKAAWTQSGWLERTLSVLALLILCCALVFLLQPYYRVSIIYGFSRTWEGVTTMLPRWQSYFLADKLPYWKFSSLIATEIPMRHGHQLFPGMAAFLLIFIGIIFHPIASNRRIAWLNLAITAVLVVLTLYFHGFTLYKLIWWIPGINSIRAVTRIVLALMWPMALFITYTLDWLLDSRKGYAVFPRGIAVLLTCLFVFESATFTQFHYSKQAAQERLAQLHAQIPDSLPQNPILSLATNDKEPWFMTEIDAMLLSQDLGWSTLNGYSGNLPPGFQRGDDCSLVSKRIRDYMKFANITDEAYFHKTLDRIVPIGFKDCTLHLAINKLD
jgi:hypothetical protein